MSGEAPKGCCGDCGNPVVFIIWTIVNVVPSLLLLIGAIMVEAAYEAAFNYFANVGIVVIQTKGLWLGLFMPAALIAILVAILTLIGTRMIAPLVGDARWQSPYRGMFIAAIVLSSLNLLYLWTACLPAGLVAAAIYRTACNLYTALVVGGVDVGKLICDLASAWEVLFAGSFMTVALHITQQAVISCTPQWCDPGCADCCCACCACCQEKTAGGV